MSTAAQHNPPIPLVAEPVRRRPRLKTLAAWALVFVALLALYSPALRGKFILDDDSYLTNAPLIQAADGLYRIWFTSEALDYYPVSNTSLWVEWRLWGLNPLGYHVTNLLLHVAACLLIWAILRQLAIPGAFLAALLFAVHPLNVESVAWIAQRKGLLALVFFLLSILWYVREEQRRTVETNVGGGSARFQVGKYYWYSFAAFVLAALSKGSVVILPLVLLIIVWWQRRRLTRWDLLRSTPYWAVAVILAAVNVWCQHRGLSESIRPVSFTQRLAGAGAVVWFYLAKALAPIDLVFVYPQWRIQTARLLWWLPLAAAVLVTVFLWQYRHRAWSRSLLLAWVFFCAALVPVLGFTDVGFMQYSLVADHYPYIALIGVVALVAAGWSFWQRRVAFTPGVATPGRIGTQTTSIAAVALVGALSFLTWQQCRFYRDAITLYQTTLSNNPSAWIIQNNLGQKLYLVGDVAGARRHYEEALRLHPEYPGALSNLGTVLAGEGRLQEAIELYQHALRIRPDHTNAHFNLGQALFTVGRIPEAIEQYRKTLQLQPALPEAHQDLGLALLETGQPQEASDQFERALRLKPDYAEAHNNLGLALHAIGETQPAIEHFREAVRLKPNYSEAYNNLGNSLLSSGQESEAIQCYRQALQAQPDYPQAHHNLGLALLRAGRLEDAAEHFQQAVRLRPDFAAAYFNLAICYGQLHRADAALAAAQQAQELARSAGNKALAAQIEGWIAKFRAQQPPPDAPNRPDAELRSTK